MIETPAGPYSWSTKWNVALEMANRQAMASGYRYRVRRSHARPDRWLVWRATPRQPLDETYGRHG